MNPVALDTMPNAREILRAVDAAPQKPVVLLLSGRSGIGKSVLLEAARRRLRGLGVPVIGGVPMPQDNGAAVVIDDLHTMAPEQLEALGAEIASGTRSVLCATQPRPQQSALRALCETFGRHGRVVELRALGSGEISSFARELGVSVPRPIINHIHTRTAGVHSGVVAGLLAAGTARLDQSIAAVEDALAVWTRSQLSGADPALLDTLVVAATGTGLDAGELAEVLDVEVAVARDLLARARTSALVTDADLLLTAAVPQLRVLLGERRYVAVQRRLLDARLGAGLLRDHTGLLLAESGVRDSRLAEFLCRAAEHNHRDAASYYAAAAAAGADPRQIALPWADAAALAGDDDTALRLAEPILDRTDADPTELSTAVRICANVLTRRGLVHRAAALYHWLGAHRVGADWAGATTVLALAGDTATATEMAADADHWPPTPAAAGSRLVAHALLASLDPHAAHTPTALTELVQSVHTDDHVTGPCDPVSAAVLLSLSAGEPDRAVDALRAAADHPPARRPGTAGTQGQPVPSTVDHRPTDPLASPPDHQFTARITRADATRHPVLAAWVALRTGDESLAADLLATVDLRALATRDRLLAHALAVGSARRSGDLQALRSAWNVAVPAFDRADVDLLTLVPLGELWLAGIELRDQSRVQPLIDAAVTLVGTLGRAPAWTDVFHWYGVQAALAEDAPQRLLPHAHALKTAAADGDRHAAVLADAGRTWLLVRRGQVDPGAVRAAVLALAARGHAFDGVRLAGDAARVVDDPAIAQDLLATASSVRVPACPDRAVTSADDARIDSRPMVEAASLSDREREVAELVLLGLTYREIGARLYISAKTVEHHVARIRRRIGARSRSELLSMLRAMGHGSLLV